MSDSVGLRSLPEVRRYESTPVHISGVALMFVGIGMAISAVVALIDGGGGAAALGASAAISAGVGSTMYRSTTASDRADSPLAFAAVAWAWLAVSIAGTMPYLFSGVIAWSEADNALFESISGFTCTGATILADIDGVAHGILFFRSMTQWFGGMGLIVLAVSVLPALKVGGLELIANEAPGPTADRFTPRIAATARRLWMLYGAFTLAVTLALLAAGTSLFDAVAHAFTTVATGGFSTYSRSIAEFDSVAVELVLIAGMITCGASFSIHWHLITRTRSQRRSYSELRWYLGLIGGAAVALLVLNSGKLGFGDNVREAAFYAASLGSNTGYGLTDYAHEQLWTPSAQLVLLALFVIGGMTGSTAGGIKVLRLQIVARYAVREVIRARHRRAVLPMRLGDTTVAEDVAARALGFVLLYLGLALAGGVLMTALGNDLETGFSGAVSAIGTVGPALGDAGPTNSALAFERASRPVMMVLMLFGRLEVFPTMLMFVAAVRAGTRSRSVRQPAQPRRRRTARLGRPSAHASDQETERSGVSGISSPKSSTRSARGS
ncbi:TrkH family potassium uptake protein [Candidatus Poriferisodalis sp.]|uniref:TrkH family potassium uptake protein n=1 Tax=Candidatus Poriferisodalis sp. TaxID=3101277 RepID=UPI003B022EF8